MYTATFYKIGHQWYLDLPEYLENGDAEDLLQIGELHELLDQSAAGRSTLTFQWDIRDFEGAEQLKLEGTSGDQSGGYYHLSRLNGHSLESEIWMNKVLYFCFVQLPPVIYFKHVPSHN
ncbi:MAG TPA: DUF6717 family protein [Flavisolibacter sp.]|jgi:hypothetical protein|nr:DUF6717 family protein [Flavisolibacter sp.]